MRTIIAFKVVAFVAFAVFAASSPAGPAFDIQHAERFALGGVGFTGVMSGGERALRAVLGEPDAALQLESQFSRATDAGRLYVLVGLRMRDRAAYKRVLALCSQHESIVETMRGCIIVRESFHSLIRKIDHGHFDVLIRRDPW